MNVKSTTVYAWLTVMLLGVSTLGMLDIFMDLHAHITIIHIVVEVGIVIFSLVPATYMLRRWRVASLKARYAEQHLQEYLQGLGQIIEQEFKQWELSEAEKKTALYILKGLSHKDIAERCHRTEGTVRQHAVSVYRKSGLGSRAEFSAHFLQQLLLPASVQSKRDQQESAATVAEIQHSSVQANGINKAAV